MGEKYLGVLELSTDLTYLGLVTNGIAEGLGMTF